MDKRIAEKVIERAKGYCESCGGYLNDDYALHHRKLRSRGGVDCPANLICVHHACHNLATHSIHLNPKDSTIKGFIVPGWADPAEYPMYLYGNPDDIVRLDDKGNYLRYTQGKWV